METTIKRKRAKVSKWAQKCRIFDEFQWTSIPTYFSANINNWKSDGEHLNNRIETVTYRRDSVRAKVLHLRSLMSKRRVHVSEEGHSCGKTSISQQSNENTQEMTPSQDTPHLPDGMRANNLVDCHVGCVVIHQIPTKIKFRHCWIVVIEWMMKDFNLDKKKIFQMFIGFWWGVSILVQFDSRILGSYVVPRNSKSTWPAGPILQPLAVVFCFAVPLEPTYVHCSWMNFWICFYKSYDLL
jgi:hypothetical protein